MISGTLMLGRNNRVSELKEAIKARRQPRFDQFSFDELKLLKLKKPVNDGHIFDIRNFTLQVDEEEDDNVTLMKDMQKIVTYWPENQTPPKDLIHVIIETPDLATDKRKHEDHIITTEGPLHPHQGSLMLPIHERDIFQVVKSELRETLRCERRLDYVHFSMPSIQGAWNVCN
ncbi:21197_t:CDS:2 [Rhizophagus irregularis]|uniref:Crinkler effector protein N-terminal domain-containing protein n=1 Tax=Rhizophagus irregularis (strain DAOM 181602 / DAOM 197198 / MUCL 43194) TaxID=747089 RepID=U9SQB3_RHIID|nr:21197_t:CDS:2 [Rhizophagus irregularis]